MARETGINVNYLSRIFNAKRTPSFKMAVRMATYLGVDLQQLVNVISSPTLRLASDATGKEKSHRSSYKTTSPDYENCNRQVVVRDTGLRGTGFGQVVYELR